MKTKKFTLRPSLKPANKCGGKKSGCSLRVSKRVVEYPYYIEDKKTTKTGNRVLNEISL